MINNIEKGSVFSEADQFGIIVKEVEKVPGL